MIFLCEVLRKCKRQLLSLYIDIGHNIVTSSATLILVLLVFSKVTCSAMTLNKSKGCKNH